MKTIIDKICEIENIHWAWEKAKSFYNKNEYWIDRVEITKFQVNYENEIKSIIADLKNNKYKLSPIKPIIFPKRTDQENENRQMFWIPVRDQVVWLAVVNVIGQHYDKIMPYWSYGNRLYISIIPDEVDEETGKVKKWIYGPYRNTTTNTYRKFHQSWTRFRKDVYITTKVLSGRANSDLKDYEINDIEQNEQLDYSNKVEYKRRNFWYEKKEKIRCKELYWCNIDLTKFYPSVKKEIIIRNFELFFKKCPPFLRALPKNKSLLLNLLDNLLSFEIKDCNHSDKELESIDLKGTKYFDGIPTGLFVAGFLSNIGLLEVDYAINKLIEKYNTTENRIAHFRYVDDITLLATNENSIFDWIDNINNILNDKTKISNGDISLKIKWEKTNPDGVKKYFEKKYGNKKEEFQEEHGEQTELELEKLKKQAIISMTIDPQFPSPLMNLTLEKISLLNNTPFEILDANEEQQLIVDLENLLITDLPEDELRKDTRMSYAASKLVNLVPKILFDYSEIYKLKQEIGQKINLKDKIVKIVENISGQSIGRLKDKLIKINKELYLETVKSFELNDAEITCKKCYKDICEDIKIKEKKLKHLKKDYYDKINSKYKLIFSLLLKAINEYPEKIKLWRNAVNFCGRTGYDGLNKIFKLLNDVKVNSSAKSYIHAYIIDTLIVQININVKKIYYKNSFENVRRLKLFINSVLKNDFMKRVYQKRFNKFYSVQAKELYNICIGNLIYTIQNTDFKNSLKKVSLRSQKTILKKYDILNWEKISTTGYNPESNFDLLICWAILELSDMSKNIPPIFWNIYIDHIKTINSYNLYSIKLFPNKIISLSLLRKLLNNKTIPVFWWLDIDEELLKKIKIDQVNTYKKNISNVKNKEQCLTIKEFINKYKTDSSYELYCLKILKLIADKFVEIPIKKFMKGLFLDEYFEYFPHNIFIKEKNNNGKKNNFDLFDAHIDENIKIIDARYKPDFIDYDHSIQASNYIFAFGILTLQLLTKDFQLPNFLYIPSNQLLNLNILLERINNETVSTYSKEIIYSSLAKRKRETQKIGQTKEDKTLNIFNLNTYISVLNFVIKKIEKYKYYFDKEEKLLIPIILNPLNNEDFK